MKKSDRDKRREKVREALKRPWLAYTIATCSAVVLFILLSNFGALTQFLRSIYNLFSPIIIGIILAYILNPLVNLFERHVLKKMKKEKLKHTLSVLIALLLFLVAVAGLMVLLIPSVIESARNMYQNYESYRGNLDRYLNNITKFLAKLQIDTSRFSDTIEGWLGKVGEIIMKNMDKVLSTSKSVGSGFLNFLLGFVLMIYFLLGRESLLAGLQRFRRAILTKEQYESHTTFFSRCNKIFVRFISLDLLDGIIIGVANAIFMLIMRMPYVPFISMIVGVTNLIPTFGPIVGVIIAALILLLNGHPWLALIFIAFSIVLQTIDSYVIKPKMFGDGFGIQGIWIVIAILVFGKMFGMTGMLLAVPLAAIISIIYHEYMLNRMEERQKERAEKKAAEDAADALAEEAEALAEEPAEDVSAEEPAKVHAAEIVEENVPEDIEDAETVNDAESTEISENAEPTDGADNESVSENAGPTEKE